MSDTAVAPVHTTDAPHRPAALPGRQRRSQAGFTLPEIFVAVVVVGIMVAVLVMNVDTNGPKATALLSNLKTMADATLVMGADMPCYPNKTGSLTQKQYATGTGNSFCATDLSTRWRGPYIQTAQVDPNGNILLPEVHPAATVTIVRNNNLNGNGNTTQWTLQVTNVPDKVADALQERCNGQAGLGVASAGTGGAAGTLAGRCVRSATATNGLVTISYIFSESA